MRDGSLLFRAKFTIACAVWAISFVRNVRRVK